MPAGPAAEPFAFTVYLHLGKSEECESFQCEGDYDAFKEQMEQLAAGFPKWWYQDDKGRKVLLTRPGCWNGVQRFLDTRSDRELDVHAEEAKCK